MTDLNLQLKISADGKAAVTGIQSVESALGKLHGSTSSISSGFLSLTSAIGAASGALAGSAFISTLTEFDRLNASLKTVTGSMAAAASASDMLRRMSVKTPFELKELTDAFIRLKSLGLDAGEKALISYGNTAAAMGKPIMQMIEAVADATTGQFERLKEFGISASQQGDKVALTFHGTTETISKDAASIEAYLRKIGDTDFSSGMADQMDTLGGKVSNLKDSFANFADFLGNLGIRGILKTELENATGFIGDLQKQIDSLTGSGPQSQLEAYKRRILEMQNVIANMKAMKAGNFGFLISNDELQERMKSLEQMQQMADSLVASTQKATEAASQESAAWKKVNADIAESIKASSAKYGVDPALTAGIAKVESGLRQIDDANGKIIKSGAGALGVMQLMPATAKLMGVNAADMSQNIEGGVKLIGLLINKYHDLNKALAAYNWGEGNLDKFLKNHSFSDLAKFMPDVAKYIDNVKANMSKFDLSSTLGMNAYQDNLNKAKSEYKATLDANQSAAQSAAKLASEQINSELKALDEKQAEQLRAQQESLIGKYGAERKTAEQDVLAQQLKDNEAYIKAKADLQRKALDTEKSVIESRKAALEDELAKANDANNQYEASAADRIKLAAQIKAAQADLLVIDEKRKQVDSETAAQLDANAQKELQATEANRKAAISALDEKINREQELLDLTVQRINAEQEAGSLTQSQARTEINAAYRKTADSIRGAVDEYQQWAKATNDPAVSAGASRALVTLHKDLIGVKGPLQSMILDWKDGMTQMEQAAVSMTEAFASHLAEALATGKTDWKGFVGDIQRTLSSVISQQAIGSIMDVVRKGYSGQAGTGSGIGGALGSVWGMVSSLFGGSGSGASGASLSGSAASSIGSVAFGLISQYLTQKDNRASYLKTDTVTQVKAGVDVLANILGNFIPILKLVPVVHSWESKLNQSMYPDRKETLASHSVAVATGIPWLAGALMPVVKSNVGYQYQPGSGFSQVAYQSQNGAPVSMLMSGFQGLSQALKSFESTLGVSLGTFGASAENRGMGATFRAWDASGFSYRSDLHRLTPENMEGQMKQMELALIKRQSVLQQFDDNLFRSAVALGANLDDINSRLKKAQKVRIFEGEQTDLTAQFAKAQRQFSKLLVFVRDSLSGVNETAEVQKLKSAYQKTFGDTVTQFTDSLASLAGGVTSGAQTAIRNIDKQVQQLETQNRELADAAKKSGGKLQYQAVSDADIQAARTAAIKALQDDLIGKLNTLAGTAQTTASQIAATDKQFAQYRKDAEALGVTLDTVDKAQQAYHDNLKSDLLAALDQVSGKAQTMAETLKATYATLDQYRETARALGVDTALVDQAQAAYVDGLRADLMTALDQASGKTQTVADQLKVAGQQFDVLREHAAALGVALGTVNKAEAEYRQTLINTTIANLNTFAGVTQSLSDQLAAAHTYFDQVRQDLEALGQATNVVDQAQRTYIDTLQNNLLASIKNLSETTGLEQWANQLRATQNQFSQLWANAFDLGLNPDIVRAAQATYEANLKASVIESLNSFAGVTATFAEQLDAAHAKFKEFRTQLDLLGGDLTLVDKAEQAYRDTLKKSALDALASLSGHTQTLAEQLAAADAQFAALREQFQLLGMDTKQVDAAQAEYRKNLVDNLLVSYRQAIGFGGGLVDTLNGIGQAFAVLRENSAALGISLGDLTAQEIQAKNAARQSAMANIYSAYYSPAEQAQIRVANDQSAINALGLPQTLTFSTFRKAFENIRASLTDEDLQKWIKAGELLADINAALADTSTAATQTGQSLRDMIATIASAIDSVQSSIADAIDSVMGSQFKRARISTAIAAAYGTLGSSTDPATELQAAQSLVSLIQQRYQLEQQAITDQMRLDQQAHDQALQAYQQQVDAINQAKTSIRAFLDSLKLSNVSPLSPADKLREAQNQYGALLLKAQTGNPDALGSLQGAAQAYLDAARAYYASGNQYTAIFQSVQQSLTQALSNVVMPVAPDEKAWQQSLLGYQGKLLSLQDQTVGELQILQKIMAALADALDKQGSVSNATLETVRAMLQRLLSQPVSATK